MKALHAFAPQASASILVTDDARSEDCDSYVRSHPAASPYHRPAWLSVITRAFGHSGKYLSAESDGRIVGVLPLVFFDSRLFGRFVVSMPFLNYGGVLADSPEVARGLVQRA